MSERDSECCSAAMMEGDFDGDRLEKARTNVILRRPYVWDCESGLERAVAWVVVDVEHR